jgi:SAM-dependent methyltransferase
VNLILPQHMRTRVPGDNAAMVDARARFLGAGHYAAVAEALVETIAANLPEARPSVVIDAGCGDGYYLWRLRESITATSVDTYGLDVSRHAIRRAARRDCCSTYVVASNHRLPLQDHSIDVLFSHFSPVNPEEFVRVLAEGGTIILGLPGPEHLFSLKQLIYSTPVPHSLEDPLAASFDARAHRDPPNSIRFDNRRCSARRRPSRDDPFLLVGVRYDPRRTEAARHIGHDRRRDRQNLPTSMTDEDHAPYSRKSHVSHRAIAKVLRSSIAGVTPASRGTKPSCDGRPGIPRS